MSVNLPPFSGLIAFYAATKHGSLTGAARELNVSQPAVSRRIAALETDLGCLLFDRTHKPAELTEEGRQLMRVLRTGLGQIEQVVEQLRSRSAKRVVTIAGMSGFIAFWLIPRLEQLEAAFPNVSIRIMAHEQADGDLSGDITVRFGAPDDSVPGEVQVLGENVFPVASPLYLSRKGITAAAFEFEGATLLNMEAKRRHWHDWTSWFEATGGQMPRKVRQLEFNSYSMVVNAALAGQGVCLCWSGLLDGFIEAGALMRLSDKSAMSQRGYYLAARDGLAARRDVRAVLAWLTQQGSV